MQLLSSIDIIILYIYLVEYWQSIDELVSMVKKGEGVLSLEKMIDVGRSIAGKKRRRWIGIL